MLAELVESIWSENPKPTVIIKELIEKITGPSHYGTGSRTPEEVESIDVMPLYKLALQAMQVRKMMSRYWENSPPFTLDLVMRQGVFMARMVRVTRRSRRARHAQH